MKRYVGTPAQDPGQAVEDLAVLNQELQSKVQDLTEDNQTLQAEVQRLVKENRDLATMRQTLESLKQRLEQARDAARRLSLPPLQYGTFLSRRRDNTLNVMIAGNVYIVNYDLESAEAVQKAKRGDKVIVNSAYNVVGVEPSSEYGEIVVVKRMEDRERVRVIYRQDEERVVGVGENLKDRPFHPGDVLLYDVDSDVVLEILQTTEGEELELEKVPNVRYEQIGSLEKEVEQVVKLIERPFLYPEVYKEIQKRLPKGVLFWGPPGCGKTLLAKAVANSLAQKVHRSNMQRKKALEIMQAFSFRKDVQLAFTLWEEAAFLWPVHQSSQETALLRRKVRDFWAWLHARRPNMALDVEGLTELFREWAEADISSAALEREYLMPAVEENLLKQIPYGDRPRFRTSTREEVLEHFLVQYFEERELDLETVQKELRKVQETLEDGPRGFFLYISGPELLDKYVGETERKTRALFERAKRKAKEGLPVVIFFDELDSFAGTRGAYSAAALVTNTAVGQLLALMDGLDEMDNVIVIGATNREDLIDPALLREGRFETKIRIPRPTRKGAAAIFQIYLQGVPVELASGASNAPYDLGSMIDHAVDILFASDAEKQVARIFYEDGTKEILYVKDFMSGAMIEQIVEMAKDYRNDRKIADLATARDIHEKVRIQKASFGLTWHDLEQAVYQKVRENKDLPQTLKPDDWVRILGLGGKDIVSIEKINHNQG
jgi:ATP-dependent 26S proteasome regulatory subunit